MNIWGWREHASSLDWSCLLTEKSDFTARNLGPPSQVLNKVFGSPGIIGFQLFLSLWLHSGSAILLWLTDHAQDCIWWAGVNTSWRLFLSLSGICSTSWSLSSKPPCRNFARSYSNLNIIQQAKVEFETPRALEGSDDTQCKMLLGPSELVAH